MIYFFVFIISCACLFFSNIYWPQYPVAWMFLIAGIMIMASQVRCQLYNLPEKRYSLLLALLFILIATIIPYPHNVGFILASAGMLLVVFFHNKRLLVNFSISLLVTGLILIVWSVINPLYYIYSSRFHELESINLLIGYLLNLFNLSYSVDGSNLYIHSFLEVHWINTSLEKTGIYFSLIFYIASLVIILFFGQKKVKTSLKVLLVLVIYIVVRYLLIILLFLHFGKADIFWNRWVEIISFIPLVFILVKFIPFSRVNFNSSINFRKFSLNRSYFYPATLIILIVFLFCVVFLFPDPGKVKEGRVLLDEMHSDWEWTEEKFDTVWYGKKSCYNYYCLADYISHYYQFERNFDLITPAVLRKYDILIIKTPTSSFENSEIRAIEEFVDAGGGLMLIGDHTNVFGTSTYINHIAGQFGLHLNYDATYDFKTGDLSVYSPPGF